MLMKCQVEVNQNQEAVATVENALGVLHKPLLINPTPLLSAVTEMMAAVSTLDPTLVQRIPEDLRRILGNTA